MTFIQFNYKPGEVEERTGKWLILLIPSLLMTCLSKSTACNELFAPTYDIVDHIFSVLDEVLYDTPRARTPVELCIGLYNNSYYYSDDDRIIKSPIHHI